MLNQRRRAVVPLMVVSAAVIAAATGTVAAGSGDQFASPGHASANGRCQQRQARQYGARWSDLRGGRDYNALWIDPGMSFNKVRGEYCTSFIGDPADGQILFLDGSRERCVINSGSAGPPMLTCHEGNDALPGVLARARAEENRLAQGGVR